MEIRFIDLFAGIGGFRLGLEKSGQNREVEKPRDLRFQRRKPHITNADRGTPCTPHTKSQTTQEGQEARTAQADCASSQREYVERAAYSCVWSCDIDKYCEQVYRRNFGQGFDAHDITTVDVSRVPDHDLLCSGFPCQSFSIAGKRRGFDDTRGTLFFEICRVLRAKRPGLLLLENVKGLLSSDEGKTFQVILGQLDELGYDCQWEVLNSKNFGVPQNRERVFVIGHLRGQPRPQVFPFGEDGEENNGYAGGSKSYAIDSSYGKGCYTPGKSNTRTMIANAVDCDGYLRSGARPRDEDGKPQLLPIGYRRLRRLTPLECERLQGFPDGWTEGVSDTQRYKMLGNAVTVNVIEAIGERLLMELGV